jgi:hypothetical protein
MKKPIIRGALYLLLFVTLCVIPFALGQQRPGQRGIAAAIVGRISIGAAMQPIEVQTLVNGETTSVVMPPLQHAADAAAPALVPGPDQILGTVPDVVEVGSNANFAGVGVGTFGCNNGDQPLDWYEYPDTRHPVIAQNLYRMSGGANNNERFEQIGQSWVKQVSPPDNGPNRCGSGICNFNGCDVGHQLCSGCSDAYNAFFNSEQPQLGSRAWVNPFTGAFPSGACDHTGHTHTGTSHRVTVAVNDLDPSQNQGATYFAEGQYIAPGEYTWCQSHPGQCNMYNNVSYRLFSVDGIPPYFTFSPAASTVQTEPAILAWTAATVNQYEPDPGNDGIWFMGYEVTNPPTGVWHYEYALYNENLDRAIQSFSVPLGPGVNISNIGFHAPPQEPGWTYDGTYMNLGYSSTAWTVTQASGSITWNSETIDQNPNANAIRWGTLYNFRFDADQPPQNADATIGFFKTGSPMTVGIQAPGSSGTPTPTPTATATATATATFTPTPTPTATHTPTPTATATATATFTPTPTPTATSTATPTSTSTPTPPPSPTPTSRGTPSARPRPTPAPRPTS